MSNRPDVLPLSVTSAPRFARPGGTFAERYSAEDDDRLQIDAGRLCGR